jgi:hypothetical protein
MASHPPRDFRFTKSRKRAHQGAQRLRRGLRNLTLLKPAADPLKSSKNRRSKTGTALDYLAKKNGAALH